MEMGFLDHEKTKVKLARKMAKGQWDNGIPTGWRKAQEGMHHP